MRKSLLLILVLFLLSSNCQADGFLVNFSEKLSNTKDNFYSTLLLKKENENTDTDNKKSGDLSEEEIRQLKKEVEKKKILRAKENWQLSEHYCLLLTDYDNLDFCLEQLVEQEQSCKEQETYGNNIYVSLNNQVLYAVKDCRLIVYSIVITGKNTSPTPTGAYHIYSARGPHYMQNEWFVNKAFYFWRGYALHDATWRTEAYWDPEDRAYYGSHGCVNLPRKTMEILWSEYKVGDNVYVYHDLPDGIFDELKQKIRAQEPIKSTDEWEESK